MSKTPKKIISTPTDSDEKSKSLASRVKKASKVKLASTLDKSSIHGHKDMITTVLPMLNVALSGRVDGGFSAGITVLAAPSKHFKTSFALLMASAFLKQYPDGIILFYDNEFGATEAAFRSFGIDPAKVVHIPITNVEELRFDIAQQLEELTREDKVLILIDSIGNMASKREIDNAINGNSAADMTRAKEIKGGFRQITAALTIKDIPLIAINHTYQTQEMYSKTVVSGGTGIYYSADTILTIGRQQLKEGTEHTGWKFIINIEKSRVIREKMKIGISVTYDSGIMKWSGLLEQALEGQYVAKPSNGWYSKVNQETGEMEEKKYREKDIENNGTFWKDILTTTDFAEFIKKKYTLENGSIVEEDTISAGDDEDEFIITRDDGDDDENIIDSEED